MPIVLTIKVNSNAKIYYLKSIKTDTTQLENYNFRSCFE